MPRPGVLRPAAAPVARPRFPSQSPIGPGFASLDPSLQDRLESLLAPHRPEPRPIERAPEAEVIEPPVAEVRTNAPDFGPVWPLGIGWLEEAETTTPLDDEPAPRPTLWSRLRAWLGRR